MDQLLIALDVDDPDAAIALADRLRGAAGAFKIGSRLFMTAGPSIVRALVERGDRVFLDLKFHDIPNTVAGAVAAATRLGVWMVDVHAAGGRQMMTAAKEAALEAAATRKIPPPLLIAVTMLTSLDASALRAIGLDVDPLEQVERMADLAHQAGLDGVVASPLETRALRRRFGVGFTIVTPGIRATTSVAQRDDQARTMTAAEAIAAGADYIVVGRPIIAAADPRAAAEAVCRELMPSHGT